MEDNSEGTKKRLANLIPFKEGESGNPAGRPKGSKNLSTILKEMLEEEIEITLDGKKERKQFKDIIVRRLVKKANDGDLRAIQEIFDRTEGKAKQEVEQSTTIKDQRLDLSKLSDEELRILAEIQRKSGTSEA
jgi:hypothetical protein